MMSSHKRMKSFEPLKKMKKIGNQLGKLLVSSGKTEKELPVEHSTSALADIFENKHDDVASSDARILCENQNAECSNNESSNASTNSLMSTSTNSLMNSTSTSSHSRSPFGCGICFENLFLEDSFYVEGCDHLYCRQCLVKFVESNIQNNVTSIGCPEPGCMGVLTPGYCRPILPNDIFARWIHALFDDNGESSNPKSNSTSTGSFKSVTSTDEPSSTFICDMCITPSHLDYSFDVKGCKHCYCRHCIVNFVVSKLQDNVTSIVCPERGCRGVLNPEYCRTILPDSIFDSWVFLLDQHGQSSNPDSNDAITFTCDICGEAILHLEDSFDIKGCNHFYCRQCVVGFISSKLQENVTFIECPESGCRGVLDLEHCRPILPKKVFDLWVHALWNQNEQSANFEIYNASTFICEFCVEAVGLEESFSVKGCSHFYCQQCIVNFVVSKLQENVTSIECPEPGCQGELDPEYCRPILPNDVFDRWGKALVENLITGSETLKAFYCPFKDCSAMLIDDGNKVIQKSKCPYCKKVFCAQCKVPWHAKIDCVEFQKLNEDERGREDIMLRNLAQKEKWRRCPSCQYYVAKKSGCSYIKCRCRFAFCYHCGIAAPLTDHTRLCPSCKH